jgi:plastocyanin
LHILPGSTRAATTDQHRILLSARVTWRNDDANHILPTSGENAHAHGRFDSGIMVPTTAFEHIFTEPGEYPYFCILHLNMVGTVRVIS